MFLLLQKLNTEKFLHVQVIVWTDKIYSKYTIATINVHVLQKDYFETLHKSFSNSFWWFEIFIPLFIWHFWVLNETVVHLKMILCIETFNYQIRQVAYQLEPKTLLYLNLISWPWFVAQKVIEFHIITASNWSGLQKHSNIINSHNIIRY